MIEGIPLPATDDPNDAEFWQAALNQELVLQCCSACDRLRFPPRPMCPHCQSSDHRWKPVSGRGKIWSFATPSAPLLPAFEQQIPYVTALVELEEEPTLRMVGPVLHHETGEMKGVTGDQVSIGQSVTIAFKQCADDVALPCWRVETT